MPAQWPSTTRSGAPPPGKPASTSSPRVHADHAAPLDHGPGTARARSQSGLAQSAVAGLRPAPGRRYRRDVTSRPAGPHRPSGQPGWPGWPGSGRRAPRDLRAADADRERVAALLAEAAADGRLTADEHAERCGRAYAARTLGELAELTADLAEPSAQPIRLDSRRMVSAFFRTERRDGRWVLPDGLSVTAMLGQVDLDLREALLQGQRVTVRAMLIGGTLRIFVPDGMAVE